MMAIQCVITTFILPVFSIFALTSGSKVALDTSGCPVGWLVYGYHCYISVQEEVDWEEARLGCEERGAKLTSTWTKTELNILPPYTVTTNRELSESKDLSTSWLGLHRRANCSKCDWLWLDGSDDKEGSYRPWAIFQADKDGPVVPFKQCAALYPGNGTFVILPCTNTLPGYICKTARMLAFEMGHPWMTYTTRSDRREHNNATYRSAYFFQPPDINQVAYNTTIVAKKKSFDELHCANLCLEDPTCFIIQLHCRTTDRCQWFDCQLKITSA